MEKELRLLNKNFKRYVRQQNQINKELLDHYNYLHSQNTILIQKSKPDKISPKNNEWSEIIYTTIITILVYYFIRKFIFTTLLYSSNIH